MLQVQKLPVETHPCCRRAADREKWTKVLLTKKAAEARVPATLRKAIFYPPLRNVSYKKNEGKSSKTALERVNSAGP
jgi:hypothetical protein